VGDGGGKKTPDFREFRFERARLPGTISRPVARIDETRMKNRRIAKKERRVGRGEGGGSTSGRYLNLARLLVLVSAYFRSNPKSSPGRVAARATSVNVNIHIHGYLKERCADNARLARKRLMRTFNPRTEKTPAFVSFVTRAHAASRSAPASTTPTHGIVKTWSWAIRGIPPAELGGSSTSRGKFRDNRESG